MKFKDWDDFVAAINELGRWGWTKKKTFYNFFTKTNTMIMEHPRSNDDILLILYPDIESYEDDWVNKPYTRPNIHSESFLNVLQREYNDDQSVDRRTKEYRSEKYP